MAEAPSFICVFVWLNQYLVDDIIPDVDDGHGVPGDFDATFALRNNLHLLDQ